MNRRINNKRYDTETATCVGSYEYSNRTDFNWYEEELYRKNTGEFFIHGTGGAASKYSKPIDQNSWGADERIVPLSYEEAQKWAEKHLTGDEVDAIFGEVPEGDEKGTVAIRLTAGAAAKLKNLAAQKSVSASEIIERMIMEAK